MANLLLAAFPPELGGLDLNPPAGWCVACAGVGAVQAALRTAYLLVEERPEKLLFIGTCGSYTSELGIGALVSAKQVITVCLDELEGRSYRPSAEPTLWEASWTLPFPEVAVAVTPAITRSESGARRLSEKAQVEHLELSGVFAACVEYNKVMAGKFEVKNRDKAPHAISFAALLAVANRTGPDAHREWLQNHAAVSTALVAALRAKGVL